MPDVLYSREFVRFVWAALSILWILGALANLIAVTGDLYVTLANSPTEDERTVAWQRCRDTIFRTGLALLFTGVALLRGERPEQPDTLSDSQFVLAWIIVGTSFIGALFEGWHMWDRKKMAAAFRRLYTRSKEDE